jgi:voltage-gated potassium channel
LGMSIYYVLVSQMKRLLERNFFKLAILLIIVVTYGTISEYYLEYGVPGSGVKSLFDSFWFTMQTITTVGYGDTPVVSFWGRINAILLMLVGIGVLGFFSASFAARLIEYSALKGRGEGAVKLKNHVLVCNWNQIADTLCEELLLEKTEVVLLAQLEKVPKEGLEFVKGTCLHLADLEKAGVRHAESVIILSETITDGELASGVDAKTILGIMNTRKLNPSTHIVAELLRPESVENAKFAGADELVVRGQVSAKLLSRGALDPGTVDIMETILSAKSGEEIFEDALPSWTKGRSYRDIAIGLFQANATPIALRGSSGLRINPPPETVVNHDSVVYIAKDRINLEQIKV